MSHFDEILCDKFKANLKYKSSPSSEGTVTKFEENQVQFIPVKLHNEGQCVKHTRDLSPFRSDHCYSSAELDAIEKFNSLFKKILVFPSNNTSSKINASPSQTNLNKLSLPEEDSSVPSFSYINQNCEDVGHNSKNTQMAEGNEIRTHTESEYNPIETLSKSCMPMGGTPKNILKYEISKQQFLHSYLNHYHKAIYSDYGISKLTLPILFSRKMSIKQTSSSNNEEKSKTKKMKKDETLYPNACSNHKEYTFAEKSNKNACKNMNKIKIQGSQQISDIVIPIEKQCHDELYSRFNDKHSKRCWKSRSASYLLTETDVEMNPRSSTSLVRFGCREEDPEEMKIAIDRILRNLKDTVDERNICECHSMNSDQICTESINDKKNSCEDKWINRDNDCDNYVPRLGEKGIKKDNLRIVSEYGDKTQREIKIRELIEKIKYINKCQCIRKGQQTKMKEKLDLRTDNTHIETKENFLKKTIDEVKLEEGTERALISDSNNDEKQNEKCLAIDSDKKKERAKKLKDLLKVITMKRKKCICRKNDEDEVDLISRKISSCNNISDEFSSKSSVSSALSIEGLRQNYSEMSMSKKSSKKVSFFDESFQAEPSSHQKTIVSEGGVSMVSQETYTSSIDTKNAYVNTDREIDNADSPDAEGMESDNNYIKEVSKPQEDTNDKMNETVSSDEVSPLSSIGFRSEPWEEEGGHAEDNDEDMKKGDATACGDDKYSIIKSEDFFGSNQEDAKIIDNGKIIELLKENSKILTLSEKFPIDNLERGDKKNTEEHKEKYNRLEKHMKNNEKETKPRVEDEIIVKLDEKITEKSMETLSNTSKKTELMSGATISEEHFIDSQTKEGRNVLKLDVLLQEVENKVLTDSKDNVSAYSNQHSEFEKAQEEAVSKKHERKMSERKMEKNENKHKSKFLASSRKSDDTDSKSKGEYSTNSPKRRDDHIKSEPRQSQDMQRKLSKSEPDLRRAQNDSSFFATSFSQKSGIDKKKLEMKQPDDSIVKKTISETTYEKNKVVKRGELKGNLVKKLMKVETKQEQTKTEKESAPLDHLLQGTQGEADGRGKAESRRGAAAKNRDKGGEERDLKGTQVEDIMKAEKGQDKMKKEKAFSSLDHRTQSTPDEADGKRKSEDRREDVVETRENEVERVGLDSPLDQLTQDKSDKVNGIIKAEEKREGAAKNREKDVQNIDLKGTQVELKMEGKPEQMKSKKKSSSLDQRTQGTSDETDRKKKAEEKTESAWKHIKEAETDNEKSKGKVEQELPSTSKEQREEYTSDKTDRRQGKMKEPYVLTLKGEISQNASEKTDEKKKGRGKDGEEERSSKERKSKKIKEKYSEFKTQPDMKISEKHDKPEMDKKKSSLDNKQEIKGISIDVESKYTKDKNKYKEKYEDTKEEWTRGPVKQSKSSDHRSQDNMKNSSELRTKTKGKTHVQKLQVEDSLESSIPETFIKDQRLSKVQSSDTSDGEISDFTSDQFSKNPRETSISKGINNIPDDERGNLKLTSPFYPNLISDNTDKIIIDNKEISCETLDSPFGLGYLLRGENTQCSNEKLPKLDKEEMENRSAFHSIRQTKKEQKDQTKNFSQKEYSAEKELPMLLFDGDKVKKNLSSEQKVETRYPKQPAIISPFPEKDKRDGSDSNTRIDKKKIFDSLKIISEHPHSEKTKKGKEEHARNLSTMNKVSYDKYISTSPENLRHYKVSGIEESGTKHNGSPGSESSEFRKARLPVSSWKNSLHSSIEYREKNLEGEQYVPTKVDEKRKLHESNDHNTKFDTGHLVHQEQAKKNEFHYIKNETTQRNNALGKSNKMNGDVKERVVKYSRPTIYGQKLVKSRKLIFDQNENLSGRTSNNSKTTPTEETIRYSELNESDNISKKIQNGNGNNKYYDPSSPHAEINPHKKFPHIREKYSASMNRESERNVLKIRKYSYEKDLSEESVESRRKKRKDWENKEDISTVSGYRTNSKTEPEWNTKNNVVLLKRKPGRNETEIIAENKKYQRDYNPKNIPSIRERRLFEKKTNGMNDENLLSNIKYHAEQIVDSVLEDSKKEFNLRTIGINERIKEMTSNANMAIKNRNQNLGLKNYNSRSKSEKGYNKNLQLSGIETSNSKNSRNIKKKFRKPYSDEVSPKKFTDVSKKPKLIENLENDMNHRKSYSEREKSFLHEIRTVALKFVDDILAKSVESILKKNYYSDEKHQIKINIPEHISQKINEIEEMSMTYIDKKREKNMMKIHRNIDGIETSGKCPHRNVNLANGEIDIARFANYADILEDISLDKAMEMEEFMSEPTPVINKKTIDNLYRNPSHESSKYKINEIEDTWSSSSFKTDDSKVRSKVNEKKEFDDSQLVHYGLSDIFKRQNHYGKGRISVPSTKQGYKNQEAKRSSSILKDSVLLGDTKNENSEDCGCVGIELKYVDSIRNICKSPNNSSSSSLVEKFKSDESSKILMETQKIETKRNVFTRKYIDHGKSIRVPCHSSGTFRERIKISQKSPPHEPLSNVRGSKLTLAESNASSKFFSACDIPFDRSVCGCLTSDKFTDRQHETSDEDCAKLCCSKAVESLTRSMSQGNDFGQFENNNVSSENPFTEYIKTCRGKLIQRFSEKKINIPKILEGESSSESEEYNERIVERFKRAVSIKRRCTSEKCVRFERYRDIDENRTNSSNFPKENNSYCEEKSVDNFCNTNTVYICSTNNSFHRSTLRTSIIQCRFFGLVGNDEEGDHGEYRNEMMNISASNHICNDNITTDRTEKTPLEQYPDRMGRENRKWSSFSLMIYNKNTPYNLIPNIIDAIHDEDEHFSPYKEIQSIFKESSEKNSRVILPERCYKTVRDGYENIISCFSLNSFHDNFVLNRIFSMNISRSFISDETCLDSLLKILTKSEKNILKCKEIEGFEKSFMRGYAFNYKKQNKTQYDTMTPDFNKKEVNHDYPHNSKSDLYGRKNFVSILKTKQLKFSKKKIETRKKQFDYYEKHRAFVLRKSRRCKNDFNLSLEDTNSVNEHCSTINITSSDTKRNFSLRKSSSFYFHDFVCSTTTSECSGKFTSKYFRTQYSHAKKPNPNFQKSLHIEKKNPEASATMLYSNEDHLKVSDKRNTSSNHASCIENNENRYGKETFLYHATIKEERTKAPPSSKRPKKKLTCKKATKQIFAWIKSLGINAKNEESPKKTGYETLWNAEINLMKQRKVLKSKLRYPKTKTSKLHLHLREYHQMQEKSNKILIANTIEPVLMKIPSSEIIEPGYEDEYEDESSSGDEEDLYQSQREKNKKLIVFSEDSMVLFERKKVYDRLQQYEKLFYTINLDENDNLDHVSIRSAESVERRVECEDRPFFATYDLGMNDVRVHVTKDVFEERKREALFKNETYVECQNSQVKLSLMRGKRYITDLDPTKAKIIEIDCPNQFSEIKICYKKSEHSKSCVCEQQNVCKAVQLESSELSSVDMDKEDKSQNTHELCEQCEECLDEPETCENYEECSKENVCSSRKRVAILNEKTEKNIKTVEFFCSPHSFKFPGKVSDEDSEEFDTHSDKFTRIQTSHRNDTSKHLRKRYKNVRRRTYFKEL